MWDGLTRRSIVVNHGEDVELDVPEDQREPLLVTDSTSASEIVDELQVLRRQRRIVDRVFEEVAEAICAELGLGEADLSLLEDGSAAGKTLARRSKSDSRLLSPRGPGRTSQVPVLSTLKPPIKSIRAAVDQLHPGSPRSTAAPAKNPVYTLHSVERTSLRPSSVSEATSVGGNVETERLSATELRQISALLTRLQDTRERQAVVGRRYADRIAWLEERKRGAILKERARR
jgi:hypothetical protein